MKLAWIILTIIMLAGRAGAQGRDTSVTRIRWTRKLPVPVQSAWGKCAYVSWHIFGIKRLVTPVDTIYTIHVARYQALGPDDADIAEEDILYFSPAGKLLKVVRKD